MLDKSVPFFDILMHRKKGTPIKRHPLPDGYDIVLFKPGDEWNWAKIEASVLEFDDEGAALRYFQADRMPYVRELVRRCAFVVDPKGEKVGTATAWWNYTGVRRDPWLHWVAVKPPFQGLGFGKALVGEVLSLMRAIEGDRDYYLHTQTWSHKAVNMYENAGFEITDERNLAGYENGHYDEAMQVLKSVRRQYIYG
ncbi:MAG: GNAT family N-acetyltransferase [Oscillospiraceae bacterium]|jgi:GNAT superfamily N-acetyltransferase|nr:GNAT family N-acetyltransferase [Oscillospiraceae bacterium]